MTSLSLDLGPSRDRLVAGGLTVALLAAATGCRNSFGLGEGGADTGRLVSIRATNLVLTVSDTTLVGVVLREGSRTYETSTEYFDWPSDVAAEWKSTDPAVATVDAAGVVTAHRPGRAQLWVTVRGARDSGTVVVKARSVPLALNAVSAGSVHTCGLTTVGVIVCWGSAWQGQLGDGSTRKYTATAAAVPVAGQYQFVALDAGAEHTCALTDDGAAYCWGGNRAGELGDGTTKVRSRPTAVAGGLRFRALSAGAGLTCGLTTAGTVYCWGRLGTRQTAQPDAVGQIASERYVSVAAGGAHACGLTATGAAYCWGRNDYGQLGAGPAVASQASGTPVPVAGGLTFHSLSAGTLHTCGLTAAGAAYCWGNGTDGRLGTGNERVSAVPVRVAGNLTFASLSAGGAHTCGVTTSGRIYCWGSNWRGQLGNALPFGNPQYSAADYRSLTPVSVVAPGIVFHAVSAGKGDHTCALAESGAAFCWGANNAGELGVGRRDNYPGTHIPVRTAPASVVDPRS